MKIASKKIIASALSVLLMLSCLVLPGVFTHAEIDVEADFAETFGLEIGETLINEDYSSMDLGALPDWSAVSGGSYDVRVGSNEAATGIKIRKVSDKDFITRAIPAGNFVAKFTAYSTHGNSGYIDNYIGLANSATADDSASTYIRIYKSYIADNKTRNYAAGSSLGYTTLSDKYDLDDLTKGYTFYIFAINGTYYFVDLDGNTMFTYEGEISHFFMGVSYSEMTVTEFTVKELRVPVVEAPADAVVDTFAATLNLEAGETLIYEDYSSMDKGTVISNWVETNGGSYDVTNGANKAAFGYKMRKNNGKSFATRALPTGNFVAKFTAFSTYGNTSYVDNYIGIANSATANNDNATYVRIFKDYIANNSTRNYANGSSLGYTELSDKYDLDDLTKGYTFYIFAVDGKYYFVDLDGNTIFTYEGTASHFFIGVSYSEMTVTEFVVKSLVEAEEEPETPDTPDEPEVPTVNDTVINGFATSNGLSVSDVLVNETYSTMDKGTVITNWVETNGGSNDVTNGANSAAFGYKMRKNNGKSFATRALPTGNFVAKFTAFSTYGNTSYVDNYIGIANSATANNDNATYVRIFKDYIANNSTRNYANGSSLGYTELSDKYDLDDLTKGYTFYIFAVDGKYYFVDLDGNTIFTYEGAASHFFIGVSYSEMTVTEFSVYGLKTEPNGTEEYPYVIEDANDLKDAIGSFGGGSYYKLANDIYLNDLDAIDWATGEVIKDGYTPLAWFSHGTESSVSTYLGTDGTEGYFEGTIDGNGYAVYGLWYPADSENYVVGLVPDLRGTIKNLTLSTSFVRGKNIVAAVSSYAKNASFEQIVVADSVTINGVYGTGSSRIAGLAGYGAGDLNFANCAYYGNMTGGITPSSRGYGLLSDAYSISSVSATNCFSIGVAPFAVNKGSGNPSVETLAARFTATNVYTDDADRVETSAAGSDGTFTLNFDFVNSKTDAMGKNALAHMAGLFGTDSVWYATTVDTTYPQLLLWGEKHNDIDKSGIAIDAGDLAAIRTIIIGSKNASDYSWTEIDENTGVDIRDLVVLAKKKITDFNYNYHIITVSGNSVAYNYVDWVNPDGATIYYQSEYAAAATELASYYSDTYGIDNMSTVQGAYRGGKAIVLKNDDSAEAGSAKTYTEGNVLYFVAGSDTLENQSDLNTMGTAVKYFKEMNPPVNMAASFEFSLSENDSAVKTINGKTYYYTWGDEFNGNTLDTTKWSTGVVRMSAIVGSLSDDEDCIKVSDGKLTLRNYKTSSGEYVQPRTVQTTQKMNFRYGYVEIKATAPFKKQIWPSFWMLSVKTEKLSNRTAPYRGILNSQMYVEYDIFEVMGSRCTLDTTIHKHYRNTVSGTDYKADTSVNQSKDMCNKNHDYSFLGAKDHSLESHVYGFEWTPEVIRVYLDGTKIYEQSITETFDTQKSVDDSTVKNGGISGIFNSSDFSGFHDPQQLIFNNHFAEGIAEVTGFSESLFEIEYVRVYQDKTMNDKGVAYGSGNVLYSDIWTN